MPEIHARTEWCPFCNPPIRLIRKNLDVVRARKGCPNCKQKFDFNRTDTPQGRKARTKEWRETGKPLGTIVPLVRTPLVTEPLANAPETPAPATATRTPRVQPATRKTL